MASSTRGRTILIAALIVFALIAACPGTWMIVGAWFTSNVQPPPKPTDESASVSEQIEALYDGQAENVEVALKEVPTEDEGSRWGYSSSWQLGTSPVKVVTWLDTADVEGHAANHPSFPQSSGLTPKTYVAVARAWNKATGQKEFTGIWRARDFGLNGQLNDEFSRYRYQDCFVVGIYPPDQTPPSRHVADTAEGWVVFADLVTNRIDYLGPVDEVIAYETRKRRF